MTTDETNKWAQRDPNVRLMLSFRDGDESAFNRLVEQNQAKVFGIVYRFGLSRSESEDIVQEVFVRVFRTASRYSPKAKFSTWLYRITANLCLNAIRSKRKGTPISWDHPDSGVPELADPSPAGPQQRVQAAEMEEVIREALADLPDLQRMAIVFNCLEQMDYKETATAMGCSTMAVKSLLNRARNKLRHSLKDHLGPDD